MPWIKRNLPFVGALAVAVALLGVGVYYLFGTMQDADAVNAELEAKNQELDGLVKRETSPNNENIEKAKVEQKRAEEFKASARARFEAAAKAETLDNASFKSLLEGTIAGLTRGAERVGVKLPDKYDFTFADARKNLQLSTNTLAPLAAHLVDLDGICRVLFDAKVHSLVSLKRPTVGTAEQTASLGSTDFLTKKVATNAVVGASVYPYEVSFQCFSTELGNVLAGFLNAPQAYVLKTINVERGGAAADPNAAPVAAAMPMMRPGGMDPALARRYGMGGAAGRYGAMQQPAPVAVAPSPTRAGETVLEEKPLRITIGLEIVKLTPAAAADGPAAKPVSSTR